VVLIASRLQPLQELIANSSDDSNGTGDALIAAVIVVPIALAVFSRRRYQEAVEVRQELLRFSMHDPLTGLPNRRLLLEWLRSDIDDSQLHNGQAGVLFVDLDRFKHVNDIHGHEIGDRLMVAVARRLAELVSGTGRVVRYGGDEFVILVPELTPVAAKRFAELVIRIIERPFTIGDESLRISACVGIALAETRGVNPVDVLHDADVAMFQAKGKGSGQIVVYDRSMAGSLTPAGAESVIRKALDDGDFHLYYQPVVDLQTGRIVGAEALLRWIDDTRSMTPDEFIPILEETGLIVPVGTWVLQEACRQIAVITQLLPQAPPMTITVNVSPRQIAQVNFVETVDNAVEAAGIDPDQVHLEITEVALLHDVGSAWTALRQVKSHGVKLALDDFGTGYSSLSYVRRFALDMLKIDKSFVDGLDSAQEDRAIVQHVIGMAHALGMATVAEGVERTEQIASLRSLGCRLAQGYVFSRPIPAGDFEAMLLKRHDDPFKVDPAVAALRSDLPVTDPLAPAPAAAPAPAPAEVEDRAAAVGAPFIDLSPPRSPRIPRILRERELAEAAAADRLVVPPGMLESDDDRRATVTPVLPRHRPGSEDGTDATDPGVVTDEGPPSAPQPSPAPPSSPTTPVLPRLREYRPDGS
jgi:diguanylate cyclase (GGDEF)-like protein